MDIEGFYTPPLALGTLGKIPHPGVKRKKRLYLLSNVDHRKEAFLMSFWYALSIVKDKENESEAFWLIEYYGYFK